MGRLSRKINDGRESGANRLGQAYCLVSLFVHHYGALGAFISLAYCLERFICALCEGLTQRVPTGMSGFTMVEQAVCFQKVIQALP